MNDQAEPVLAAALERLVENRTLTQEQADAVRTDFHTDLQTESDQSSQERNNSWTAILAEVGGYIGAAFVVAAAMALLGSGWDNFSQGTRIGVLAGPAVLLLGASVAVAMGAPGGWSVRPSTADHSGGVGRSASPAVRRLVGALVLASGVLLAGAAAVIGEPSDSYRWIPLVPLVLWGVSYSLCRGVPLHLGTAVALTWSVFTMFDGYLDYQSPLSALVLILAGAGWAALTRYRLIEERALGIVVAGVMAFIGGENAVVTDYEGLGYLSLALLAAVGLTAYIRTHELSALGVGAATLAVVVPQVVIDYTEGSLGAAGGLLVSGLSVVAVSVFAARLRQSTSGRSGPTQVV